ncbi:hypothetical protein CPB86DRAFT_801093 [Serendipita vermifera]|nr:hypothetical protein CPB86DRAFT_801093 [Serendipita vermifera]
MFFIITPQDPSQVYYNPEEAFEDYRRREYVAALREEQAQRAQFERELALEEERHRRALASLHQQEILRRRQSHVSAPRFTEPRPQRAYCRPKSQYTYVDPEEILRRRQARKEEEQRRAREFHQNILSKIFGVPEEELATPARTPPATSKQQQQAKPTKVDKGKQREDAPAQPTTSKTTFAEESEQEPHWSAAPLRAAALAEISSINRAFSSLKNTFTFPSGPLERLAGSDLPRLAYNPTNASIHAYEHALSELLSKLDGIESHGFKGVREARKQLVVKIEKELEDLEKQIAERLAGSASPAVASTSIPIESASPVTTTVEVSAAPVVELAVDTEMTDDNAAKAPATEGYDVEFEEPTVAVPEPTPAEQPVTESNETAMEVEPPIAPAPAEAKEVSPTPVPTPSVFAEDATKEPEVEVAAQEPQPVEQVATDTPISIPAPAPAPVSEPAAEVLSDEDSEIEDAVHVVIESTDDEKEVDEKREPQPARDQEGDFELV